MDVGLVCDACSAFNEMGAGSCSSCSAGLSLDGPPGAAPQTEPQPEAPAQALPDTVPETIDCPNCGAAVAVTNRFCGACGCPLAEQTRPLVENVPPLATPKSKKGGVGKQTLFFSSIQAAKAKLVLIKGEGYDGESYALAGEDHRVGRDGADIIFDEDEYLSPIHANFFYAGGRLMVKDEGSVNGVYLRIRGSRPIEFDDHFLVGEQVMQVKSTPGDTALKPKSDGTYFYSSPRRPSNFRLAQILHGGNRGLSHLAMADVVSLGREGNDINFPEDPFISGHHAQVEFKDGSLSLTDLGSKNGTFVRLTTETQLEHGDYVFMGQQLLRVEIV